LTGAETPEKEDVRIEGAEWSGPIDVEGLWGIISAVKRRRTI